MPLFERSWKEPFLFRNELERCREPAVKLPAPLPGRMPKEALRRNAAIGRATLDGGPAAAAPAIAQKAQAVISVVPGSGSKCGPVDNMC